MRRPDPVAAQILRAYRREGVRAGVHTTVRWSSCPFPAVEALVPHRGRVLDIGCGHGAFATSLALRGPERIVEGVDPDAAKIDAGGRAARRLGVAERVRLTAVDPDWRPPPNTYDAVVIVDVLYLLGPDRAGALVAAAIRSLVDGGVIVVKEMDTRPRAKWWWNLAQERLAVQVLRLTRGDRVAPVEPSRIEAVMVDHGLEVAWHEWHHGYLHPHLGLVGRRR